MNTYLTYGIIFVILLLLELVYFKIADKFNIIDKPNERSSHSTIVLRGGGVIFLLGVWVWEAFVAAGLLEPGMGIAYPWFLAGLTVAAMMSFVDDVRSLPDGVRLVGQFVAMGLTLFQLYCVEGNFLVGEPWWMLVGFVALGLIIFVGASNIINFMDGINGITGGYALAVVVPLALVNCGDGQFVASSLLAVVALALIVFCVFNFRPKGKAKCFAGDVGSIGIGFILLFLLGSLVMKTGDVTWFVFLLVYGVDGCCTIVHRMMLHENLGEAHRKHAFQLMANELGMSHPVVACLYMALQLVVSLGFVWLCPVVAEACGASLIVVHWGYLIVALAVLAAAYVVFVKKYYHLHEEYLAAIKK